MKCKDCYSAVKGFFKCYPDKHVCIGVKEPFVIDDIDIECTEYPEKREETISNVFTFGGVFEPEIAMPYVDDEGIYVPHDYDPRYHKLLISKELFVEAYNKWIKGENNSFVGQDTADDWCD